MLQHISARCSFCSEVILPILVLCPAALLKNSCNSTLKEKGSRLQLVSHGVEVGVGNKGGRSLN